MEQTRLFEAPPAIEPGALYYDRDRRRERQVRVESVEGEYAICHCTESGRMSRIRVDRLSSVRFADREAGRVKKTPRTPLAALPLALDLSVAAPAASTAGSAPPAPTPAAQSLGLRARLRRLFGR
jgi:hypothetical protein